MCTQLRHLLNEALKVNLSAAIFNLLDSKDIRFSVGRRNGIDTGVMVSGKILEQHTNTHAIAIDLAKQSL